MATRTAKKTKRRRDVRVRKTRQNKAESANGETAVHVTADRLANAQVAERHLNDARLTFEECKAKAGAAKAEYKLLVAKRNRVISTATDAAEVEEAQHLVANAYQRLLKAKGQADAAKDELKGWEEHLQKALSGEQPLFDELRPEASEATEEPQEAT